MVAGRSGAAAAARPAAPAAPVARHARGFEPGDLGAPRGPGGVQRLAPATAAAPGPACPPGTRAVRSRARPRRAGAAARGVSVDDRLRRRRIALDERRLPARRRARGCRSSRCKPAGGKRRDRRRDRYAHGRLSRARERPCRRAEPHAGERRRHRSCLRHRSRRRTARRSRRAHGRGARTRGRASRHHVGARTAHGPGGRLAFRRSGHLRAWRALRHRSGGRVRGRRDPAQLRLGAPRRPLHRVRRRQARPHASGSGALRAVPRR